MINIFGIAHLQDAFKHGDASKVYPIGGIPQQILPIILYYGIYSKPSPKSYSIYLLIAGTLIILIAGFLLGARQGQLEIMNQEEEEESNSKEEPEEHI